MVFPKQNAQVRVLEPRSAKPDLWGEHHLRVLAKPETVKSPEDEAGSPRVKRQETEINTQSRQPLGPLAKTVGGRSFQPVGNLKSN